MSEKVVWEKETIKLLVRFQSICVEVAHPFYSLFIDHRKYVCQNGDNRCEEHGLLWGGAVNMSKQKLNQANLNREERLSSRILQCEKETRIWSKVYFAQRRL